MGILSWLQSWFGGARYVVTPAQEMTSAEKRLLGEQLRANLYWWPCACLTEHGPDATCKNCNGFGCVQPHDWCAACPHRRGDDCSQFALGLSRGWRKRGGAWHAGGAGRWRQYRCPRYAGPETAPITGQEDTGG